MTGKVICNAAVDGRCDAGDCPYGHGKEHEQNWACACGTSTNVELTAMDAAVAAKDAEIKEYKEAFELARSNSAELDDLLSKAEARVKELETTARVESGYAKIRVEELTARVKELEEERDKKVAACMIAGFENRIWNEAIETAAREADAQIARLDKLEDFPLGETLGGLRGQQKFPIDILAKQIRALKREG